MAQSQRHLTACPQKVSGRHTPWSIQNHLPEPPHGGHNPQPTICFEPYFPPKLWASCQNQELVWVSRDKRTPKLFSSPDSCCFLVNSFFKINYFNWRVITILQWFLPYINMSQPWVHTCPPILNPPPTSLPTPTLWVVPENQLWVPCLMHGTCTGHLFLFPS